MALWISLGVPISTLGNGVALRLDPSGCGVFRGPSSRVEVSFEIGRRAPKEPETEVSRIDPGSKQPCQ